MPRPKGQRDGDYEDKRRELLRRMTLRIMRREVARPSVRELATAAEVTVPTLRHYFGGRPDVVEAILAECLRLGRAGLDAQASSDQPFAASIEAYAKALVAALLAERDVRLGDVFAVSLAEGLLDPKIAAGTLSHIIDPTIDILQARLEVHRNRGEMACADTRSAALMLISPLLVACLHQDQLAGAKTRPMALDALTSEVTAAFIRAYRA